MGAKRGIVGYTLVIEGEFDTSRTKLIWTGASVSITFVDNLLVLITAHDASRYYWMHL